MSDIIVYFLKKETGGWGKAGFQKEWCLTGLTSLFHMRLYVSNISTKFHGRLVTFNCMFNGQIPNRSVDQFRYTYYSFSGTHCFVCT